MAKRIHAERMGFAIGKLQENASDSFFLSLKLFWRLRLL